MNQKTSPSVQTQSLITGTFSSGPLPPVAGKRGFGSFAVTCHIPVLRGQPW